MGYMQPQYGDMQKCFFVFVADKIMYFFLISVFLKL